MNRARKAEYQQAKKNHKIEMLPTQIKDIYL